MLLFEQVEQALKIDIENIFERKDYLIDDYLKYRFFYSLQFCVFYIINIPRILFLRWFHKQKLFYLRIKKINNSTIGKCIRLRFETLSPGYSSLSYEF